MVSVVSESVAELGYGSVSMSDNVIVNLLVGHSLRCFHVRRSDAQTAVQIRLVRFERRQDDISTCGAMLVRVQNGEDELRHFVEKVIEQVLVAIVDFNHRFVVGGQRAMGIFKEVEVDRLLGKLLTGAFKVLLLHPRVGGIGAVVCERWLIRAEGGYGGIFPGRNVVDINLMLGLDVHFVRREHGIRPRWNICLRRGRHRKVAFRRCIVEVVARGWR